MKEYHAIIATTITVGTLIFNAGKESNRIDELFRKANSAEIERKNTSDVIYDIHGKVSGIEKDIQYMKEKL